MFADSPAPQRFWHRHPWLSAAALLSALWLLQHHAYAPVLFAVIVALSVGLRRRRRDRARREAGLRARADLEHRMVLSGDPRGVHGRYPPVRFEAYSFGQ